MKAWRYRRTWDRKTFPLWYLISLAGVGKSRYPLDEYYVHVTDAGALRVVHRQTMLMVQARPPGMWVEVAIVYRDEHGQDQVTDFKHVVEVDKE